MENVRIVSETRASSADVEFIRDGLSLYNVAATADSYYAPLAIFARDERDAILGGGYGHVWGGMAGPLFVVGRGAATRQGLRQEAPRNRGRRGKVPGLPRRLSEYL